MLKAEALSFWQTDDSSIFGDARFNAFPFQHDGKAQKQWYTNWLTWSFDHVSKHEMVKADTVVTDLFVWHRGSRIGVESRDITFMKNLWRVNSWFEEHIVLKGGATGLWAKLVCAQQLIIKFASSASGFRMQLLGTDRCDIMSMEEVAPIDHKLLRVHHMTIVFPHSRDQLLLFGLLPLTFHFLLFCFRFFLLEV